MKDNIMNSLLKTSLSASVLTLFLSAPAFATDLNKGDPTSASYEAPISWTGFYVGGQVGLGIANSTTTVFSDVSRCWAEGGVDLINLPNPSDDRKHDINVDAGVSVTNLTEDECKDLIGAPAQGGGQIFNDPVSGASGSYDYATGYTPEGAVIGSFENHDSAIEGGVTLGGDIQIQRFVVGAFAEYNWSAIDGKDNDWVVGGRGGVLILPRLLAYGHAGYAQAEYGDFTFEGIRYGAGLEAAITQNIFLGGQYSYTDYDSDKVGPVEIDLDEHKIMATAKFKLNGGLGF